MLRFAYMLAARLGVANPRELLETLPARVMLEWQEYHALEPLCDQRADLRAGVIASTLANIHAGKGRRWTAAEFSIVRPRKQRKTVEEMAAILKLAANFAGDSYGNS